MNNNINTFLKKDSGAIWAFYAVIFIAVMLLSFLFPYTGDDWAWGSSIGIERLNNWFDNYSGRYLGNIIVLAITRSRLLRAFLSAFCLTGIVVIINSLTSHQKNGAFIILCALLFAPVTLLRQAVVWASGFANYTVSVFLTLLYILYLNNVSGIYSLKKPKSSAAGSLFLIVLGFASALVVEHITVYNVILAVYAVIFTFVKFKKVCADHIAYLVGTVAGCALMFSNSVYSSIANGNDAYRNIDDENIISHALNAFAQKISVEGFFYNTVLNVLLACVCFAVKFSLKNKLSGRAKIINTVSLVIITAYSAVSLVGAIASFDLIENFYIIISVFTAIYIVSFIAFICSLPLEPSEKTRTLFIILSVGVMLAPLLAVEPVGSRCFFASYVMMVYLAMQLYALTCGSVKRRLERLSGAAIIISAAGIAILTYIYGTIYVYDAQRADKVIEAAQSGEEIVEVERLPYSQYTWYSDIKNEYWANRYKKFYGIDSSIKIKQIAKTDK